MKTDVYGRGITFPFSLEASSSIRESAAARKIEESIRIILGTQHRERVMRPTFGCNLKSLVFAPNNEATASLARHYVEEGLATWEPRIDVREVLVENDNARGELRIHVRYFIKSTQEARSLVYPFYLEKP